MNKLLLILCSLLLLTSCNSSDTQQAPAGGNDQTEAIEPASRPDTITTTISIEGIEETMDMYLLESPEGFHPKFSTYVPVDMRTDRGYSGEGDVIRIWAHFGGISSKDAQLIIRGFPDGINAKEAREAAKEAAQRVGETAVDTARYGWADQVFSINGERIGFLALAKEKDRWFYLLAAYPPEYADGMGPRLHQLIRSWQWKESGTTLRK